MAKLLRQANVAARDRRLVEGAGLARRRWTLPPLSYVRARPPHMVNIARALFESRTGWRPLHHLNVEALQELKPLDPLKGFRRRPAALKKEKVADRRGAIVLGLSMQ